MPLPSAEAVRKGDGRLALQEAMELVALPGRKYEDGRVVKRFMSRRRVWVPGDDYVPLVLEMGVKKYSFGTNAFGGHVYCQSGLVASLTLKAMGAGNGNGNGRNKEFGIHTIHGFFSEGGRQDRPYLYEVTNLASNASFPNLLITARQPLTPSSSLQSDPYPLTDADLPLGPVCFSAMVSFRPTGISQLDAQESPVQTRFADILSSRRPMEWDPAPITDIDGVLDKIPGSRKAVGLFPILDMRKVDMRSYNKNRPLHERRELILYRLLKPLPATAPEGDCEIGGPDAHICAHAYGADRNGLLMIGNHVGFGHEFARAASLSYSFVVHVNAEQAVMQYSEGDDQWWVQEVSFPRVQAGRGIVHCKVWSPQGLHVATEFQDGIIRRLPRPGEEKGKL